MRFKLVGFSFLLAISSSNAFANSVQTNLDGVVIKNIECVVPRYGQNHLKFNIANRSSNPAKGTIIATLFDQDSDPIDHGKTSVNIGPVSGDKLRIDVDCTSATKYTFRIE